MVFISKVIPGPSWRIPFIILLGAIIGLGFYVLHLSNATSYLSDKPEACINCHVMTSEYITWANSSHREVAHCNDCHVPHNNVLNKYYFKAKDGLYHAAVFSLRMEPQAIQMRQASREVVQANCIRCHVDQVTDARLDGLIDEHHTYRTDRTCWECHKHVPHGRVRSLASVGYFVEPLEQNQRQKIFVPDWLEAAVKGKNDIDK